METKRVFAKVRLTEIAADLVCDACCERLRAGGTEVWEGLLPAPMVAEEPCERCGGWIPLEIVLPSAALLGVV